MRDKDIENMTMRDKEKEVERKRQKERLENLEG